MIRQLYNYYFSSEKEFIRQVKSVVGFTPCRIGLFKMAFAHRSLIKTKNVDRKESNERLEYLGDAILSTVVAEYLYNKYPNKDEGFLTQMRSKIVKRKTLNILAQKMELELLLNRSIKGRVSSSMLGNALEALIGAIYLELGYKKTKSYIINKILRVYLNIHELETHDDNYKSQLLEYCQKNGKVINFNLVDQIRVDKRDKFKIAINVDGKDLAFAEDFNKKAAEQKAAKLVVNKLV